jgi:hypothetical protein
MDFTKFVSLLDTSAVFFSRADHLSDAWEGAHTTENLRRRPVIWGANNKDEAVVMDSLLQFHRSLRLHTFMSCWHLNDVESAAMWKLYVSHNEGIAIQTTFGRLVGSFQGDESDLFQVYVGKVEYLDYEMDRHDEGRRINHDDPAVQFQEWRRLARQVGLPEGRTGVNRKAESWEDRERKKPSSTLSATSPRLLLGAESPQTFSETRAREVAVRTGAKVRNIVGPGEVSAAGTPGETGVNLPYVPKTSDAAKAGLFAGNILLAFNGKPVKELQIS